MAPKNGTTIIKSEISYLISALNFQNKINGRLNSEDSIYKSLVQLRNFMNEVDGKFSFKVFLEFYNVEPIAYLSPFLNLIKSEETNGPITESALISIEKFLSYGFIDSSVLKYNPSMNPELIPAAAEAISSAVAQSRFQGGNKESDETVLMKILQVIRTLVLLPIGSCISNESILELLKNCFRICFGKNVSDLLKKSSEQTLASIIQLFFSRIPQLVSISLNTDVENKIKKTDSFLNHNESSNQSDKIADNSSENTSDNLDGNSSQNAQVKPYNLTVVRDLLLYMTELLNPEKNTDIQISTSLNLLTIALETGADALSKCPTLLFIIKSKLTKYLVQLLNTEKVSIFTATCRLSILLFESMRSQLKLQMEIYILRIVDIISIENEKFDFYIKEIALDFLTQLLLLPGMMNELFLNYDCSPYTQSILMIIAETLSKNSYPVQKQNPYHIANLEVLLSIIEIISRNYNEEKKDEPNGEHKQNRHLLVKHVESVPSLEDIKQMTEFKMSLITGTEKFNAKPSDGIAYLQEHGILKKPFDPEDMAKFLTENPRLDKKAIGDYISNRKNSAVLNQFVKKLNFENMAIDDAIRVYLEAFRLPGEAPLIQHLIEYFSEQWVVSNPNVFANVDSVFTLSYAILMLNTDQHNPNSKKQNVPMNMAAFQRNLKGMNGGNDFDQEVLAKIYQSIHLNEIIMPSEQAGQVRDNYLWKVIMRRSAFREVASYRHYENGNYFDSAIFKVLWGPTVSAISTIFDKTSNPIVLKKTIIGFTKVARIASHYGQTNVIDNLIITLCKFTSLFDVSKTPEQMIFSFGRNNKTRLAASLVFTMALDYANQIRDGWGPIFDCLLQLFKADLLPDSFVMTDDFAHLPECHEVKITSSGPKRPKLLKKKSKNDKGSETGIISSFYSYFYPSSNNEEAKDKENTHSPSPNTQNSISSTSNSAGLTPDADGLPSPVVIMLNFIQKHTLVNNNITENTARKYSIDTLRACQIDQIFVESKFLQNESLNELVKVLILALRCDTPYANVESLRMSEFQMDHLSKQIQSSNCLNTKVFYQDILHSASHELSKTSKESDVPKKDSQPIENENQISKAASPLVVSAHLSVSDSSLASMSQNYQANNTLDYFSTSSSHSVETRIFCMEMLFRILIFNKDRVSSVWPLVRGPICELVMSSIQPTFFIERTLVNLVRLANRLIPNQEQMFNEIMGCLLFFLVVKSTSLLIPPDSSLHPFNRHEMMTKTNRNRKPLHKSTSKESISSNNNKVWDSTYKYENSISQQVVSGISEFIHNHAADLYNRRSWELIFTLLEICGSAVILVIDPMSCKLDPKFQNLIPSNSTLILPNDADKCALTNKSNWIIFDGNNCSNATKKEEITIQPIELQKDTPSLYEAKISHREMIESLNLNIEIGLRDPTALEKSVNILMFLIKDPAYLMPENIEMCIHCLRVMTEACLLTNSKRKSSSVKKIKSSELALSSSPTYQRNNSPQGRQNIESSEDEDEDWDILSRNEEETNLLPVTARILPQINEMSQILFFRTKSIYTEWNKNLADTNTSDNIVNMNVLWSKSWLPLLKITCRICMDSRRDIITDALSLIHKQLLSQEIAEISPENYSQCINQVLFPLLACYLEDFCLEFEEKQDSKKPAFNQSDPRLRSIPLLTKCFLQRLDSLYELDSFSIIWNQILLFMQHFILASNFDILTDAVREYLKNVLLVMYTGSQNKEPILMKNAPENSKKGTIWKITIDCLTSFLPELIEQLSLLDEPMPITNKNALISKTTSKIEDNISADDVKQEISHTTIVDQSGISIPPADPEMATNLQQLNIQPFVPSSPTSEFIPINYQNLVPSVYTNPRQPRYIPPQMGESSGHFFTPFNNGQSHYDPNQYFSPPNEESKPAETCIQQEPR